MLKTAIVIPDRHIPLHDESACNIVKQAIDIVKPDVFIDLGDVGEWDSVSHWKYKRRKRPPLEYQLPKIKEEIEEVNNELDDWDKILKNVETKIILKGNHDVWLDDFCEENPYDELGISKFRFKNACRWIDRGYKYYEHNVPLQIGKLLFIHGAFTTMYHTRRHLECYGMSIMYGHCHDVQHHTQTKVSGTIGAWSIGCLKDMSREKNTWLRGNLHNWKHAFAIVQWFPNHNFRVEVVDILKGKTTLWGNELEG